MAVIKNKKTGMWEVRTYYKDLTGERKQKTKRGFAKKSEALEWERNFKLKENQSISMSFKSFVDIYLTDLEPRIKRNTFLTKKHIIETKILPYFGKRKLDDIRTSNVIQWQNEIMKLKKDNGELFSQTYLKTIHNQLSAILNHAVNMYGLKDNVARKAGTMGKEENKEMEFWTQEEFQKFLECVADKPISYYAFEMLYWTGIREGELLALTPAGFNFEKKTLRINKSYQRLEGEAVIMDLKTPKSNRTIVMPDFLAIEMEDFIKSIYGIKMNDRIFTISKSYLHHEMDRGAKLAGVKRIRIHGLRHSHISLLINLGFSALAIGERVGHEAVDITYHYAHLFPTVQTDMAAQLETEREALVNVRKNRDDKNRWRNVTIAFRMSPEENEELNNRVKLSGFRTKQDYIIQSVLHQKVVATGNPLMLVQFRKNLQQIERELERIEKASDMDGELLTPIRSMLEILEGFKEQPRTLAGMKKLTVPNEE